MPQTLRPLIACTLVLTAHLAHAASIADFVEFNRADSANAVLLPGRLYVPADYAANPNVRRPLILFLHGSGASGTDNEGQLNFNIDNLLFTAKQRGAFLYAPQTNAGWESPAILSRALEMIDLAIEERSVDPRRIYVTGLSMGGGGAWNFLSQYPDRVAATVPICGVSPAMGFIAAELVDEPIWAFHGRRDTTVPVEVTREVIGSVLAEAGLPEPMYLAPFAQGPQAQFDYPPLNLHYTDMTGGHGITPVVYHPTTNRAMYNWMFAQVQAPEPGAFALAFFALGVAACKRRAVTSFRPILRA